MNVKKIFTILANYPLTPDTFKMVLKGDTSDVWATGQFVNIKLEGLYLRRPISIHEKTEDTISLIYKVVGKGTEQMSAMVQGQQVDMLVGLGNGFDITNHEKVAVIGGGVGVPPLYDLAKELKKQGKQVTAILGFNSKEQVFCEGDFRLVCDQVVVTTVDGTYGVRGFVTTPLANMDIDYFYACGPEPMLKALHKTGLEGQMSFEERMGCGFGACMGCTCKTLTGYKRICVEGPVMKTGEVTFDE